MASSNTSRPNSAPALSEGPLLALMGPTASGKSALALELAERLDGEIVSADSMQLYRGLDVGTAKPSAEERRRIPHHLLDVLDIAERSDLFSYCAMAEEAIAGVRSRGRLPILAGGTGLYMRAMIYGLDPMPADPALRARLDAEYDSDEGFERLKERMRKDAPQDFERWHSHRRRLIRALEVLLISGKPMTELQTQWPEAEPRRGLAAFKLSWSGAGLKGRIDLRCGEMLRAGWIEEAKELLGKGLLETPTARQALGYQAIAKFLAGSFTRQAMEEDIKTATWQFARRQGTWFRNQHPEAAELKMPRPSGEAAKAVIDALAKKGLV